MSSRGANLYGLDEKEQIKKMKIGELLALGVLVMYILIGALTLNLSDIVLPAILFIVCLLFGPVTLVFYLIEVKKGVFRVTEEELLEMEAEARQS